MRYAVFAYDNSVDSMLDNTYSIEVVDADSQSEAEIKSTYYDLSGLNLVIMEVSLETPLGECDRSELILESWPGVF